MTFLPLPPLYKYLDVQGANLTLDNRTFRHAKPSDFNDAEELTIQSIFPDDVETALKKLSNSFTDVIVKHINDPPTCAPEWKGKLSLIQGVYRNNPKAVEVVREQISKDPTSNVFDVEHMRRRSEVHLQEINKFMQGYRVFCVTRYKDSERMWNRYAQAHQGIALRIQGNVEKDSKFQLFQPIHYRVSRPSLYDDTLSFLEDSLFGDHLSKITAIIEKIIYSKTLEWEYEGEYRLAIPVFDDENWNAMPYEPEEITELYLGLAMTQHDKDEIVRKAKSVNSHISIFQTRRDSKNELAFDRL